MIRRIADRERVPGGFMITVEIENAFTDGASRFEKVFVSRAEMGPTKTKEEKRQAIRDALDIDPIKDIRGDVL